MSKEVLKTLDELIDNSKRQIELLENLRNSFSNTEVKEPTIPLAIGESKKEEGYTFEDVRGLMASLAKDAGADKARELITKYGGNRLSDIKEESYASLVKDIKGSLNG